MILKEICQEHGVFRCGGGGVGNDGAVRLGQNLKGGLFNMIIVITGKAGKGLKMRDMPVELFVKLSQVRCSYGIEI